MTQADEVEQLRDALSGLLIAVDPFRKCASYVDNMRHENDSSCPHRLRAGDLRALRAAADRAKDLR